MHSNWALAACLALALTAAGPVHAEEDEDSVISTVFDRPARPFEDRSGEFRTTELDTWTRLTPFASWLLWEGGAELQNGPMAGLALEFEPADVLIVSIELGSNFPMESSGGPWAPSRGSAGARVFERGHRFIHPDGTGALDLAGNDLLVGKTNDLEAHVLHPAVYLALKNPELEAGVLKPMIGFGVGAFYMHDSQYDKTRNAILLNDGSVVQGANEVSTGALIPIGERSGTRYGTSLLWHGSLFVRFDFDVAKHFKFGFNFKYHAIFYAYRDRVGKLEPDTFAESDTLVHVFEPSFYLSFAF